MPRGPSTWPSVWCRRRLRAGECLAGAEPGALLFHPYISEGGERGPFVDRDARAAFFGLSTRHGHADLVRAVFEGLAFAARDCYAAMGPLPREIRISGGAARSHALRAMLAAALEVPSGRFYSNIRRYGNTSSASMLIAADEWQRESGFEPGKPVVFAGFGAGFHWGALLAEGC